MIWSISTCPFPANFPCPTAEILIGTFSVGYTVLTFLSLNPAPPRNYLHSSHASGQGLHVPLNSRRGVKKSGYCPSRSALRKGPSIIITCPQAHGGGRQASKSSQHKQWGLHVPGLGEACFWFPQPARFFLFFFPLLTGLNDRSAAR